MEESLLEGVGEGWAGLGGRVRGLYSALHNTDWTITLPMYYLQENGSRP